MGVTPYPVLTIGHSTHSLEALATLLQEQQVNAVADVRSSPYSRFNPQFNREALAGFFRAEGIRYAFLGRELGGRSDDPACFENGRVRYTRLARTEAFGQGIERVLQGARDYRMALMCAEKDPLECHRTLLVAHALAGRGVEVRHILADGRVEPHEVTMDRLLDLFGLPHQDLFRLRAEVLAEALARQEERVAFVDPRLLDVQDGERR